MIVSLFIKSKIYEDDGLVSDVFMMGLTNSFIPPLLKVFNKTYYINRFIKQWNTPICK